MAGNEKPPKKAPAAAKKAPAARKKAAAARKPPGPSKRAATRSEPKAAAPAPEAPAATAPPAAPAPATPTAAPPGAARPAPASPTGKGGALAHQAAALTDMVAKAAASLGREDLEERLALTARRLKDPALRVLVVGEYKQGKSTLINALLGARICPVDDDVATSVPTEVRFEQKPTAVVSFEPDGDGPAPTEEVAVGQVAAYVVERKNPGNVRRVRSVAVGIPAPMLAAGMVLVDTPGVGGLGSAHTAATVAVLPLAEAVILVSDASQEYSGPELDFLGLARDLCPNILCVVTKVDFYPEWRKVLGLDGGHLQRAGIKAGLIPVSSALRERALAAKDPEMDAESGFPALVAVLRDQVIGAAEVLATRAAANDMLGVLGQLAGGFASEQAVLSDPEQAAALVAALTSAKEESERLRSQSARWQQTLGDGFSDLGSDVDFDLRSRIRAITQAGEEAIDQADPAEVWDEFEAWMQRRATAEVAANYAILARRSAEISQRVAEHFETVESQIEQALSVAAPTEALEHVQTGPGIQAGKFTLGTQGMNVIKSAWGGVSMFGYIGGMVGMGMINPFTVVIGVLMGGKAIKDERQRQLTQRRGQAKAALRKYIDEVNFQVGKDSRDAMRRVQRELRDTFTTRADELQRSMTEALASAQGALQASESKRARRLKEVQTALQQLAATRAKVAALAPDLAQAPAAAGG